MKKTLRSSFFFLFSLVITAHQAALAQCNAGSTRDTLNWDYLDFLPNSGTYVSPIAFLNLAQSQTQQFTFGTQSVKVTHDYTGTNVGGDVTTHTGETGSFGKGADIRFRGNGNVNFTFRDTVRWLRFSLHDVDYGQTVTIVTSNGVLSTAMTATTLTGSILTVTGTGTSTVVASSAATAVGNNANTPASNATLNIEVPGPVDKVSITVSNSGSTSGEDGSFYISDLSACSYGTFPMNYYYVSKPFAGQPSYFLAVKDNQIFYVNVANGVARLLFKDNGHTNINSLAYDPYRHMVYYAFSLTNNSQSDRTIYRYDYDMDTMGVFINNVNNIGIPTFQTGVESGAAAFYDGAYYLGIEGNDQSAAESARESIVWRIDLNSSYQPTKVAQVWATPVDDGAGNSLHDWSDIGINDGIMYDFDGATGRTDFYHKNLLTGSCVNIKPSPSTLVPRQVSVTWAGQMYNSGSPNAVSAGYLTPYNGNGTVNTALHQTMTYQGVAVAGSWGDAGEAFKPKTDFGDAPASYDPSDTDPGTHERNDSIRIGNTIGIEWNKHTSVDATGDGAEEDGISGLQVVPAGVSNFVLAVKVLNRTARNATLAGWIDANGNGLYDPWEGTTVNVPSSSTAQTVNLFWPGLDVTLPAYSNTFLRLRIATASEGLTVNKPNGYLDNGEIEDHQVTISMVLPEQKIALKAAKTSAGRINLQWDVNNESGNSGYELMRSCDGINWATINNRLTSGSINAAVYRFTDSFPCKPASYYRVSVIKANGNTEFSAVRKIDMLNKGSITVTPNPSSGNTMLTVQSAVNEQATLKIFDLNGRLMYTGKLNITEGLSDHPLAITRKFANGTYKVNLLLAGELLNTTMVVLK